MGTYYQFGINEKFEIRGDSTFEYTLKSGYLKSYSSGTWAIESPKGNVLLLKSTYHKEGFPLFVNEVQDLKTNDIEVRVEKYFERAKDTILWMTLVVNDTLNVEFKNNIIKIPKEVGRVKKLHLIFYYNNFQTPDLNPVTEYTKSVKTGTYEIKNENANVFYLSYPKIGIDMFYYLDFDNDKFTIKGKKLHWLRMDRVFELE